MNKYIRKLSQLIPDSVYLKMRYWLQRGKKLDLCTPKSFNEKIQWLKLHDRKEKYTLMVDKYEAKEYVAGVLGENVIIPTLGVWNSFDDIDFDSLPDQFVLKCTHDSGGLVIVRDKHKLNKDQAAKKINNSMNKNYYWHAREWPYKNVKPRIIAEQYMQDKNSSSLVDYKFFCFNGIPQFVYCSVGLENHATASISFFDLDGQEMPFHRSDFKQFSDFPGFPDNFNEMKEKAQRLATEIGSPFVRVDLYSINGGIYFSEITFSPCGGQIPFEPAEWDEKLGELIDLSGVKHDKR